MNLVSGKDLLPPSVCIICESSPGENAEKVIDTLKVLNTGTFSTSNGRKYVCEQCGSTFAKLLGFEKGADVEKAKVDKEVAESALANFKAHAKEIADAIVELADHPGAGNAESPVVVKKTPAKVAAKKE